MEVGACAKGWEDGPTWRNDSEGDDCGGWRGVGRKLRETVQVKTGVGKQGGGCHGWRRGRRGREKGRGRGAGGGGWLVSTRGAGCRETRGPMGAHQLSLAPSACPYMERPLPGARAPRHIRAGA